MTSPSDELWLAACDLRSPVDARSLWAAMREATVVVVRIGEESERWYIKETPGSAELRVLSIVAVNHWQVLLLTLLVQVVQADTWMPLLQEGLIELSKSHWQEDREARALMFRMAADSGATQEPPRNGDEEPDE